MPWRVLDPTLAAAAPAFTGGAPLTSTGETLASIVVELLLELGNRSDIDVPRVHKWINWAYRNLAGMLKVRQLEGSVLLPLDVEQPFYLLPPSLFSVERVGVIDEDTYYEGGRPLLQLDTHKYRKLADLVDEPTNYLTHGKMIVVYPDPMVDRDAVLDFRIRPDNLVNDTDSPILPLEYHESLLLFARHRAFRSLRNYQEAAIAMNDALQALRPLRDQEAEEESEIPSGIQVIRSKEDLIRQRR